MGTDNENNSDQQNNEKDKNNPGSLESFTPVGFKLLVQATKKSNNLPSGKSRDLYESYPSFHSAVEKQANYVLSMLSIMLKNKGNWGNFQTRDDEDKFEMIVDINDALMENVGTLLDELSGIRRNPEVNFISRKHESVNGSWNKTKIILGKGTSQILNKILNQTKNIEKPQLKFRDKIDNDANKPFEPRIKYKYNLLKPLACLLDKSEGGIGEFSHPYEFELEKFKPLPEQLTHQPPVLPKSLDHTPLVFVNTLEDVTQMVEELEKYKEIAVDLEHHSYRSFQGFTCLMQISTRDTDYIVDTLQLRSDLEILNKVFTNPSIIKVFHGADLDVLWLQRDLALYVVNMFDTHQAAKLLNFPKLSLSYLLSFYCGVAAQKQFQLADWRVRPLPPELITYAREDTHYLLFIYDNLRNLLIEKANKQTNLLEAVISESTRICLKRYVKPSFTSDGHLDLYHRSKKLFDNRQKFALQRLYEWRDKIARESDESYAYVLPDHMMLNISEVLPREAQGILACCNPVPVPVRQNLLALHQLILKAREQPLIKPILEEQRLYKYTASITSSDNPFHCPHDLNHEGEFRDDLPVLFSGNDISNLDKNNFSYERFRSLKPWVDLFEKKTESLEKDKLNSVAKKTAHLTPYQRYKMSKKFSEFVEEKTLHKAEDKCDKVPKDTSNEGNHADQTHKNLAETVEVVKGKADHLDKANDRPVETVEVVGVKETLSKEEKINEKHKVLKKRQLEEEKVNSTKKPKKESAELVLNPFALKESKTESFLRKTKNKKMALEKKEKSFKPFDYNSVDLNKYQSSAGAPVKKSRKKYKMNKKSGKKNFGISI